MSCTYKYDVIYSEVNLAEQTKYSGYYTNIDNMIFKQVVEMSTERPGDESVIWEHLDDNS